MLIREAKYKKVKVTQNRMVEEAVYGCDECGEVLPEYPNEPQRLEITIFRSNSTTEHEHFCSWDCVFKRIPKIHTDHFVSLPFIMYDEGKGKRTATGLLKILKRIKL